MLSSSLAKYRQLFVENVAMFHAALRSSRNFVMFAVMKLERLCSVGFVGCLIRQCRDTAYKLP